MPVFVDMCVMHLSSVNVCVLMCVLMCVCVCVCVCVCGCVCDIHLSSAHSCAGVCDGAAGGGGAFWDTCAVHVQYMFVSEKGKDRKSINRGYPYSCKLTLIYHMCVCVRAAVSVFRLFFSVAGDERSVCVCVLVVVVVVGVWGGQGVWLWTNFS